MPEVNYALGGSVAAYSIRGRFGPKYSVTGKLLVDSGLIIPNVKIGQGAISGLGELTADYSASDDTDKSTTVQVIGVGQPVASGTTVIANEGDIEGVGVAVADQAAAHTTSGDIDGVGELSASVSTSEGHDIVISGVGEADATITTARNVTGEAEGVGEADADGAEDPAKTFLEMIQAVSADSGLEMCLDAAALGSYPGSGQTWTDLTGQTRNFYRGANSSTEGRDPTFNGTAGALSENEYFSFDGGDYFTDTGGQTWADDFHKNNAEWTFCGVDRFVVSSSVLTHYLFSTAIASSNTTNQRVIISGRALDNGSTVQTVVQASVRRGNGDSALSIFSPLSGTAYALVFWALALDEATGAGGVTLRINTNVQSLTSTFSSPSSSDPVGNYLIGRDVVFADGTFNFYSENGMRTYCRAAWSRRLSTTELANIYNQLKSRYSALP